MITVRVHKYDGSEHKSWTARVLKEDGTLLVLDAEFAEEVQHDLLGTIARGTKSIEYYWLDRWYNVFCFLHPDGSLRNYYCNVNIAPGFDGQVLSYVDLDIDILVQTDFSYAILDLDEFEENAKRYGYPNTVVENAQLAVQQLVQLIENRSFPFADQEPE